MGTSIVYLGPSIKVVSRWLSISDRPCGLVGSPWFVVPLGIPEGY